MAGSSADQRYEEQTTEGGKSERGGLLHAAGLTPLEPGRPLIVCILFDMLSA